MNQQQTIAHGDGQPLRCSEPKLSKPRVPVGLPGVVPKQIDSAGIAQNQTQKRCHADRVRPDNPDESSPEALAADQVFRDDLTRLIPSLCSFARGLCGRWDLADDLAQDAMMRGWAARSSFTPGTNFKAWMFVILRNQFYTLIHREKRMVSWDPEVAERVLVEAPSQLDAIHVTDVAKTLKKLPPAQREVLMLVGANGVPYEEAAKIIGCAVGTVKSRLARGRMALALIIDLIIDGPADQALLNKAA